MAQKSGKQPSCHRGRAVSTHVFDARLAFQWRRSWNGEARGDTRATAGGDGALQQTEEGAATWK